MLEPWGRSFWFIFLPNVYGHALSKPLRLQGRVCNDVLLRVIYEREWVCRVFPLKQYVFPTIGIGVFLFENVKQLRYLQQKSEAIAIVRRFHFVDRCHYYFYNSSLNNPLTIFSGRTDVNPSYPLCVGSLLTGLPAFLWFPFFLHF